VADLALLAFISGLAIAGFRSGFLRRLIGLAFMVVSFVVGAYLRAPAGAIVHSFLPKIPQAYAEMVGYSVAFGGLVVVLNLFAKPILARIPNRGVSRVTDQALGAALGLAEAVLLASAAIVILHTYSDIGSGLPGFTETGLLHDLRLAVDDSTIGGILEKTTVPIVLLLLGPFLPKDLGSIVQSTIPGGVPGLPGGIPVLPTSH
jgi:uncharacterized membrane protein required for colicin V production